MSKTSRRNELLSIVPEESKELVDQLINDVVFLENQLSELKKLPFIKINHKNPMQQRNTPAAKMYKEFLQQYTNCIKLIEAIIYRDKRLDGEETELSPLREYLNSIKRG